MFSANRSTVWSISESSPGPPKDFDVFNVSLVYTLSMPNYNLFDFFFDQIWPARIIRLFYEKTENNQSYNYKYIIC